MYGGEAHSRQESYSFWDQLDIAPERFSHDTGNKKWCQEPFAAVADRHHLAFPLFPHRSPHLTPR